MSFNRKLASRVLPLLTKAGWVEQSFLTDVELKVKWTPKGEEAMRALLHLEELPRVVTRSELAYMVFLAHFFFDGPSRSTDEETPQT